MNDTCPVYNDRTMENLKEQEVVEKSQRVPYQTPQVVDYGNAAEHTQATVR